jgi:hypothetical protein
VTDREEASIREIRAAVSALGDGLVAQADTLKSHVEHAKERHADVLTQLGGITDTIRDLRAERSRTLVTVISEWGSDAVPIPLTSGRELKLRTLIGLVGLIVGALLALGWADTAARWVDGYLGTATAAEVVAPTDAAGPPEPTP